MEVSPLKQETRPDTFEPKVVQLYRQLLKVGDDDEKPEGFWRELFLLKPDTDRLVFLARVFSKRYTNTSSDIIEVLAGLDNVDSVFTDLVATLDTAIKSGRSLIIRRKAVQVALCVTSGAFQTGLLTYFTQRDLFPSLMKLIHDLEGPLDATQPFLLAGLLANYNKFESRNPYHIRLADFVNDDTIKKIARSFSRTCAYLRDQYVAIQEDAPEAWSIGGTLSYIGLGALAGSKPATPVLTEDEMKTLFVEQPKTEAAALIAVYDFALANKIFFFHWSELWRSLLSFVRFLTAYVDDVRSLYRSDLLVHNLVNLLTLSLTQGESFLPDSTSYDDLFYKLVEFGDSLTKFRDAYFLSGDHEGAAAMGNLIGVSTHYSDLIAGEKKKGKNLSPREVSKIIKDGYDTLSIEAKEGLDHWDKYREADHKVMLKKILAIQDTNLESPAVESLRSGINSIDVVRTWTWPYPDLPGLLAQKLGAKPLHTSYSDHGGNQPAKLLDEAARRIATGRSKVAVVTGGEALASLTACAKAKKLPPPGWTKVDQSVDSVFSPTSRDLNQDLGGVHAIGAPIHVYPLYENAFRAHRGQSVAENNKESSQLYADFAQVAAQNPLAWNYGKPAETEESIGTVSKRNRMICFPYPLLMNAFNTVDLAGACILTSTEYAEELGIAKQRWIYPRGGAGTRDSYDFWKRPNFHTSPALSQSIDKGLEISGIRKEDIDLFDFYSCFPIVPKLACRERNGMILANGGVLTYQHVVCLSSEPRSVEHHYPLQSPLPGVLVDMSVPEIDAQAEGHATVETYTVEFGRDGNPLRGYIVGRLTGNGHRFIANHGDENTLRQLSSGVEEQIGKSGMVRKDEQRKGRNLFSFERTTKL
ncbi:hypothetical protein MBLNU459_g8085t1 [Dothideomycetes sp. NU459]